MFIDPEVAPGRPPLGGPCLLARLILPSPRDVIAIILNSIQHHHKTWREKWQTHSHRSIFKGNFILDKPKPF